MNGLQQLTSHATQLTHETPSIGPQAASPASITKFEQLLGSSSQSPQVLDVGSNAGQSLLQESENISSLWSDTQNALENLLKKGSDLSPADALALQYSMVKTSVMYEVTSKAGGMTEKGMESLFQRNG
jgi:hypothetical protein